MTTQPDAHTSDRNASNEPWDSLSPRERWRDLLFACAVIGGSIFVQLQLGGGAALFSRDLWLDEIFTYRIASDPDFLHSMRAVQSGIDLSPPGYQVLARGWTMLFGVSEVSLRALAFTVMMLAVAGLYLLLRLSAHRMICCAAVLAVWSNPLIIEHAFDARFYAPWLASIVWYCFFWQLAARPKSGRWALAGLALCSFLACSFHYFGIVSLALVVAGELALGRLHWKKAMPLLVASLTGPLATLLYIPLFWVHQISVSDVNWTPYPTLIVVSHFIVRLLFPAQLVAVLLIALLSYWSQHDEQATSEASLRVGIKSSTGLIALIALVPLLIVVSYLSRPVVIPRYAIPVVACLAPAVVIGLRGVRQAGVLALIVVFTVAGTVRITAHKQTTLEEAMTFRALMSDIEANTRSQSIFFENNNDLLTGCHYAPHLAQRCFYLSTAPGELPWVDAKDSRVFNRAHQAAFTKSYPLPAQFPWSKLKEAAAFYLVLENTGEPPPPVLSSELYPGFTGRQLNGRLFLMRRATTEGNKSQVSSP